MRWRLTKHKAGFVCIIYEGSNRRRIALKAPNKWLAQAEASDLVADIERRKPKEVLTVAEILRAYLDQTEAICKQDMGYRAKSVIEMLGGLMPDSITETVCKNYAGDRKRSAGTLRSELGIMNTALRWAKKKKLITEAPYVWMPPSPPPKDRRLTRDEAKALRDAAHVPHLSLYIELALGTAARSSALLELRWAQIDMQARRIALGGAGRQKSRGRGLPINDTLHGVLTEAQTAALTPFVIEYAGRPLKSIDRGFNAAVSRAGLDRQVTPHVLRHTAASWMAEAGIPMSEIAAFLGHRDSRITERVYAKYSPDYLQKAAKALG